MDCTAFKPKCKIPKGLQDLMADISREVLRNQPTKINNFIAEYLEAMLITRENIFVGQHVVDYVIDSSLLTSEIIQRIGIELEKANQAAIVIQRAIRKFHLKRIKEVEDNNFNERDVIENLIKECGFTEKQALGVNEIIENAFKNYYYRAVSSENTISYTSPVKWNDAAENTLKIYRKSGPLPQEMARAAVSIQAAYKGYYTRKTLKKNEESAIKIQAAYKGHKTRKMLSKIENQAIKIQSFYRGHLVRKNMKK